MPTLTDLYFSYGLGGNTSSLDLDLGLILTLAILNWGIFPAINNCQQDTLSPRNFSGTRSVGQGNSRKLHTWITGCWNAISLSTSILVPNSLLILCWQLALPMRVKIATTKDAREDMLRIADGGGGEVQYVLLFVPIGTMIQWCYMLLLCRCTSFLVTSMESNSISIPGIVLLDPNRVNQSDLNSVALVV